MKQFKTRREQIEKDFLPRAMKSKTRKKVLEELRGAAMVGACEERDRTINILRRVLDPAIAERLVEEICLLGVLEVCGWEERTS